MERRALEGSKFRAKVSGLLRESSMRFLNPKLPRNTVLSTMLEGHLIMVT